MSLQRLNKTAMRRLKFNILFVFVLALINSSKAYIALERINFAEAYRMRFNSVDNSNLYLFNKKMNKVSVNGLQGFIHKPLKRETKGLLQQLIRSNLKLKFRVSKHLNFVITYN